MWHRNGQPITSGGRFWLDCGIRGSFSLVIHSVHEEDKGKYTCEATNGSGARQVTVELTVEGESQEARALVGGSGLQLLLQLLLFWERNSQEKVHLFLNSGPFTLMRVCGSCKQGRRLRRQCLSNHTSPHFPPPVFLWLPLTLRQRPDSLQSLVQSGPCLALQTISYHPLPVHSTVVTLALFFSE